MRIESRFRRHRGLIPGWRVPWLTMRFDAFFDVARKLVVDECSGASRFQIREDFGDQPACRFGRFDHCERPLVSFDDDLDALPDFLQDGMHIAGKFGFRNANGVHVTDHSLLFSASLSSSDSVDNPTAIATPLRELVGDRLEPAHLTCRRFRPSTASFAIK